MSAANITSTRKVAQVRFYNSSNINNYPSELSISQLISGKIFKEGSIIQLGIQGLPGTKFYINGSTDPVILGYTGIYELNVDGISTITELKFDKKSIETINDNPNAYLIVDFIYETGG